MPIANAAITKRDAQSAETAGYSIIVSLLLYNDDETSSFFLDVFEMICGQKEGRNAKFTSYAPRC